MSDAQIKQKEEAFLFSKNKKIKLSICALGNSVGTPENGIKSMVIEVKTFEEYLALFEKKFLTLEDVSDDATEMDDLFVDPRKDKTFRLHSVRNTEDSDDVQVTNTPPTFKKIGIHDDDYDSDQLIINVNIT